MAESVLGGTVEPGNARDLPGAVQRVFGDLRGRLDGELLAIAADPDGTVWSIEEGGILRSWEPETGRQTDSVALSEIESCWAFSPDARLLASGSNGISVWDVPTATLLARLAEPSWMVTLAFSPDGKTVASGHDDNVVRLWDFETGKPLRTLCGHGDEVCTIAFNADGTQLATAGEDLLVYIWDVASGKRLCELKGHTDRVDSLAFSHSSHRIASAGWDTSVRVWDPKSGELLAMLNGQGECVHSVVFSPDGQTLVCGDSDCVVRVWDYNQLKILHEFRRHQGAVKQLVLFQDGKRAASGGTDRSVQFWNIAAGKPCFENQGSLLPVAAIAVSEEELDSLHADGHCFGFDFRTGHPTPRSEAQVTSIARGKGGLFARGFADGSIAIEGPRLQSRRWKGHPGETRVLAISADEKLVGSASTDGMARLWDPVTGEPVLFIPEAIGTGSIEAMAFHPRQPLVAVAGIDWGGSETGGTIAIWNWRTRSLERRIAGAASRVVYSADGALLASVGLFDAVFLWNAETGELERELSGRDYSTNAVAFDPMNRLLASGSDDFGLRVWDLRDWSLLCAFDLETTIKDLAFTPSGRAIVTGNGNTTCYLVDLESLSTAT